MAPPVLVAVVSWNTRELLDQCLASLAAPALAGQVSVTVVDNDSDDGSIEMAAERHPWATTLPAGRNLGFGAAVNLAVAQGPGCDWVMPMNADAALEPGALEALLAAGAADPGAGAIAPRLILPDGTTQHSAHPFPTLGFGVLFNLGLHRLHRRVGDRLCLEGFWDPERARRVPWAIGACTLVRREAWDVIDGFDPALWLYAEDLDMGWRLRRAGWQTRYEPSARVRHASEAATGQAFDDPATRWQAATYEWLARRRGPALARAIAAVNVAGALARWLVRIPLARVRPRRFAYSRDTWRAWTRRHAQGLRARAPR